MPIWAHSLRDRILDDYVLSGAAVGSKLPTNVQLADRYSASPPTVVKALRFLTQEGWVTTRRGSGTYVAARPSVSAAHRPAPDRRIGCVLQSFSVLSHRVLAGMEKAARRQGSIVEVAVVEDDYEREHRQIKVMLERGVQGVVLCPTLARRSGTEYLATEFPDYPIVVVDLYQPAMKRPHVLFDNLQAGREMTRFLLEQGRREIVFLKVPAEYRHRTVDDRVEGYRRALAEAGVAFAPERVMDWKGDWPTLGGVLERALALQPRPTAIVTPQDPCAEATVAWLRKRGVRVPEDIAVAGFDNLQHVPWTERFPTTQPDFVNMGERAAEILLERASTRDLLPTGLILPCPLVLPSGLKAAWHTDIDERHVEERTLVAG